MKLRSLIIRLIVVWIPIMPPTPLIANPHVQPSPRIRLCGPESPKNSFHAWSEPQDCALQHRLTRLSLHIGIPESKGV